MTPNTLKVIANNIIEAKGNTSIDSVCPVDIITESQLSKSELNKTIDLISIKAFATEWEQENDEYWNSY